MYCKKCGCVIDDDAIFCYKCGTKQFSENKPQTTIVDSPEINDPVSINEPVSEIIIKETPVVISEEKTEKENEQNKTACRRLTYDSIAKKNLAFYSISAIIGVVWAIDIFSKIGNSSYYDNQRILACFLIVLSLAEGLIATLKYMNYKKRFVNIYNSYICGIGPGSNDFTNEKFEIQYKDIVKLDKGDIMKTITIHAESAKQIIPVDPKELDDVYLLIRGLIDKAKNNS